MHIEFKRIILHNFMSFGDADLRFNDDGFIRVSGINENPLDNARSNGSGKSSLWEAIVWVLTGETIRGTKQIVNLYGNDGCFVDIEFYIDNTRYQLIRSKDHKAANPPACRNQCAEILPWQKTAGSRYGREVPAHSWQIPSRRCRNRRPQACFFHAGAWCRAHCWDLPRRS